MSQSGTHTPSLDLAPLPPSSSISEDIEPEPLTRIVLAAPSDPTAVLLDDIDIAPTASSLSGLLRAGGSEFDHDSRPDSDSDSEDFARQVFGGSPSPPSTPRDGDEESDVVEVQVEEDEEGEEEEEGEVLVSVSVRAPDATEGVATTQTDGGMFDWDAVNADRIAQEQAREASAEAVASTPGMISHSDAWTELLRLSGRKRDRKDASAEDDGQDATQGGGGRGGGGLFRLCGSCLGRRGSASSGGLSMEMAEERDDILAVKGLALDHSVMSHELIFAAMLKRIVVEHAEADVMSLSTGQHWVEFGFQRVDPMTDLRACGMFGATQILRFAEVEEELVRRMYKAAKGKNEFPFACVSLNWTAATLNLLQNEVFLPSFVKEAERGGSLLRAVQEIYQSLFFRFYHRWVKESHSLQTYGVLKKEIELEVQARGGIGSLVRKYEKLKGTEV